MIGQKQRPEGKTDLAGTSEDKRINQSKPCTDLLDDQKNQKDSDPHQTDKLLSFFMLL